MESQERVDVVVIVLWCGGRGGRREEGGEQEGKGREGKVSVTLFKARQGWYL